MQAIGYTYLIDHFSLEVLPPYKTSFLSNHAQRTTLLTQDEEEEYFPAKYLRGDSWRHHLLFALRHEGVNLSVLKALFRQLSEDEVMSLVQSRKISVYSRRVWFFYEFLTGRELPLEALKTGNYQHVLPPADYFVIPDAAAKRARRQRLICNLPGNAAFCPMVRITKKLGKFREIDFSGELAATLKRFPAELIYRANSFLYLKETKSSYAIEHQNPSQKRISAFLGILQLAGNQPLTKEFLIRLQNCIVDKRYAESDYRSDQVYVGQTIAPGHELIHFIGVKPADLPEFMQAFLETAQTLLDAECDPIITAAVLSFAFVFIHPFNDGNGRLHRYLLHHVLAARHFNPEHIQFPVSAVLYKNPRLYDRMLESFSKKLLPLLDYCLDSDGAMTVKNETADFYRFIDFTTIAEELYGIVAETLRTELIPELEYLVAWEKARERMRDIVDMPEKKARQLMIFIQQNQGCFPKSRRCQFPELTDEELAKISSVIKEEIFERDKSN
ncbi:MAG: Fic family protein [Lentisphaerae bacterium]|nr:Fic family protein [Lentisphaerota bacterium]